MNLSKMTKRFPFESDGRYAYGFTPTGFFTLISREGESLYEETIPLCEKLGSHLIWIFLWASVAAFFNLFSFPIFFVLSRFVMAMIFLHIFLFGCRLTTLLMKGGFRPIFFPPLWIRVTRQLQKGGNFTLLKRYHLDRHPGLLVNLALIEFSRRNDNEGRQALQRALAISPEHPVLQELAKF